MKRSLTILSIAAFTFLSAQKPLDKVEPMFWWKGMKNPELQIMVYGKDIANKQIELSDHVAIKDLAKTDNPNYVFITVNTNEIDTSRFKISIKEKNKVVGSYTYELKQRKAHSEDRNSFSSKDVVYLIMPDRFANGDTSNDQTTTTIEKADRSNPNGRHGGDLKGIVNHLDYLQNLGVTSLWLTPANEDNEKDFSYHGYAQTDLYKIDPRYGSNEDYVELSRQLKKRNMKLIMDYVTNHWGISHWMIKDLPTPNWIHQFPEGEKGFRRSNYRTTTQFDPYAAKVDRVDALNGWFDTTMPDINQNNPLVLTYLKQNAIWWIEYADLDGLRVDTYPYNNKEAMAKWAKAITDEYPKMNIVGETWMNSPAFIAFWQKDSKVGAIENYNSNLPSVMDFTLFGEMPAAFQEEANWDKGMIKIYNAMVNDFLYPDVNNMMVFFENHDTQRWNEIFKGDPRYYKMAMSLISTVRGIPQIYYGSEIGMQGDKDKGDGDIRRDFPGGWRGDAQNAFNPNSQTAEQKSFYDFTKKLLNWRKNKEVIHTGKTLHFSPIKDVYVYFRYNDKERVMVLVNGSKDDQTLDASHYAEGIQDFTKGKDVTTGTSFDLKGDQKIKIPAKSALILELSK